MPKRQPTISLVRAYEADTSINGYRVLVDRLWPRGLSKSELPLDEWLKSIAPSTELRRWFNHLPERWTEFKKRYRKELSENSEDVNKLLELAREKPLVLIYGARDEEHNHAIVLRDYLLTKLRPKKSKKR